MSATSRLLIVLFTATLPPAVCAAGSTASAVSLAPSTLVQPTPLQASELRSVRSVGGAVLMAQRSYTEDPELGALRLEVAGLAQTLDEAIAASMHTSVAVSQAAGQPRLAAAEAVAPAPIYRVHMDAQGRFIDAVPEPARAVPSPSERQRAVLPPDDIAVPASDDPLLTVRQAVAQVDLRLRQYQSAAQARGGERRRIQAQAVAAKVGQLRDELTAALTPSSGGWAQLQTLTALRQRMRLQSVAELMRQPWMDEGGQLHPPVQTPTVMRLSGQH